MIAIFKSFPKEKAPVKITKSTSSPARTESKPHGNDLHSKEQSSAIDFQTV